MDRIRPSAPPRGFDALITGAVMYDGMGGEGRRADLAITGDRIAAIGDLADEPARERFDAAGLALAPGFIDAHAHDDRALLVDPALSPKVSQGVTTVIVGNCGVSLAPLPPGPAILPPLDLIGTREDFAFARMADYVEVLARRPAAVNAAILVGHQTLRLGAMADLDRPALPAELARMEDGLREGLAAGAIGLSTGLAYQPSRAAPTAEIIALARIAGQAGGIYATHLRDEGDHLEEALEEALEIGRAAELPVVLSHHKAVGRANHGKVKRSLARIATARARQHVDFDVYPYAASSTVLEAARVRVAERTTITWSRADASAAGRDVGELMAERGLDLETLCAGLRPAGAIYFSLSEDDVASVIADPHAMIGSDGLPHDAHPHPRLWGTFPRVLGRYARERGLLSFADALRRMTSLPARVFGLEGRGRIVEGGFADLVILDAAHVIDAASFDRPIVPARGIVRVLVNGETVWARGAPSGARPGRILRRAVA